MTRVDVRRLVVCATAMVALAACGGTSDGGDTNDSGSVETTTTIAVLVETSVAAAPDDAAAAAQSEVFRMVREFLSQTLAVSPALSERVPDVEQLATCMVNAGYQINGLPMPGMMNPPTTLVPPQTMISPMLTYLVESCTGIPASEWIGN